MNTLTEDAQTLTRAIESTGTDENALLVTGGAVSVDGSTVTRASDDSTGGDASSFYGVGAAILATGGTLTISNSTITTDSNGGAGVFAYGDAVVTVSDATIATSKDTSGGVHVAGGGALCASNLTVTTEGASSAAVRSDRGGGTLVVDGGSYTASGSGSPAVYVTADVTLSNAALTATGSEALCLEGLNSCACCTDCDSHRRHARSGSERHDLDMSSSTRACPGDSQVGKGTLRPWTGGYADLPTTAACSTPPTPRASSCLQQRDPDQAAGGQRVFLLRCTGNSQPARLGY